MKKSIRKAVLIAVFSAIAIPAHAVKWGDFKDNGCVGKNLRSYSAVLWDIPWGQSWEDTCSKTSATVAGNYFPRPTQCVKTNVVDAVSLAGLIVSIPGIVYPPAGVAGVVIGSAASVMSLKGVGALNMWGVFYVQDPKKC